MSDKPLVSVIIPVFKRPEQIGQCLKSLQKALYPRLQIIVVDDNSGDQTVDYLKKNFSSIQVLVNKKNRGASYSRDYGASKAIGDYLFFLDSDTEVAPDVISELVSTFYKYEKVGLVAPIIYYYGKRKLIWYAGAKISLVTSQASYRGIGQIDKGQFQEELLPGGHAPTACLIKTGVFKKTGGFRASGNVYMGFEEPDIAKRIEILGFRIVFNPRAKVWHKIPTTEYRSKLSEFLFYISFRNERIAYATSFNRVIFMKKYASYLNYSLFLVLFLPLSLVIYFAKSVFSGKKTIWKNIWQGTKAGLATARNTKRITSYKQINTSGFYEN